MPERLQIDCPLFTSGLDPEVCIRECMECPFEPQGCIICGREAYSDAPPGSLGTAICEKCL